MARSIFRMWVFSAFVLLSVLVAWKPLPAADATDVAAVAGVTGKVEATPQQPAFRIAEDMQQQMQKEVDSVTEELQKEALGLFRRTPLGFDLSTIGRLHEWALTVPGKLPTLVSHVKEQGRLLGLAGSLIMLAFLAAVVYSLIGQDKVVRRVRKAMEPLRARIPDAAYPYLLSTLKVVIASLIPLLLYGTFCLVQAATAYPAAWFRLTGSLLKLWVLAALTIRVLRELLTRGLFAVPAQQGKSIFRVARLVTLYIIACVAVLWGAQAFQIPADFYALLKFSISLCIVSALLLLMLKKKTLLGILPDLPYNSYRVFLRGLEKYYFPAVSLTFLTGLMWCGGFHVLCKTIWIKTWGVGGSFLGIMVAYHLLQGWLRKWMEKKGATNPQVQALHGAVRTLLLYAMVTTLAMVTLDLLGILVYIERVLSFPLAHVGQAKLSLWTLIKAGLIVLCFVFGSKLLRAFLDYRVYPTLKFQEGLAYAVNMFLNYFFLVVGCLFAMRSVGIDLRVLLIFAGALGIGIGLGFQNTAANLISGFSIVFGGKVRKGEVIRLETGVVGRVEEVGLGCTKVVTPENVEYSIPNGQITSQTVVNYSRPDPMRRFVLPVGVSYGSDPREVKKILLRIAEENPEVHKERKPAVLFKQFADNSLNFDLIGWVDTSKAGLGAVMSELHFAIFDAFAAAKIEIPFPQRDIHIRSADPLLKKA